MTSPELLESLIHNILQCSICCDEFKTPKTLPCLHSFCQKCLEMLAKTSRKRLHCPICRTVATIKINALPTNFYLIRLQELLSAELLRSPSDDDVEYLQSKRPCVCSQCWEAANLYCYECSQYNCTQCQPTEQHSSHRVFYSRECVESSDSVPTVTVSIRYTPKSAILKHQNYIFFL